MIGNNCELIKVGILIQIKLDGSQIIILMDKDMDLINHGIEVESFLVNCFILMEIKLVKNAGMKTEMLNVVNIKYGKK